MVNQVGQIFLFPTKKKRGKTIELDQLGQIYIIELKLELEQIQKKGKNGSTFPGENRQNIEVSKAEKIYILKEVNNSYDKKDKSLFPEKKKRDKKIELNRTGKMR